MLITLLIIFRESGESGAVEVRGVRFKGFLVDVEVDELGDGVWVF